MTLGDEKKEPFWSMPETLRANNASHCICSTKKSKDYAVYGFSSSFSPYLAFSSLIQQRTESSVELSSDIDFIKTPAAKPSQFETGEDCETALTNVSPAVVLFYQIKMAT